jgi:hypothetical protein
MRTVERTAENTSGAVGPDDIKQCAILLGLQIQSVVVRVNFSHEKFGVYIELSENSRKSSLCFRQATCKTIPLSCVPNFTEWFVKHKVLNVSKIK